MKGRTKGRKRKNMYQPLLLHISSISITSSLINVACTFIIPNKSNIKYFSPKYITLFSKLKLFIKIYTSYIK